MCVQASKKGVVVLFSTCARCRKVACAQPVFVRTEVIHMEILILSLVAGVFVVGGLWMASRNAKPTEFREEMGVLADSAKLAADGATSAVDDAHGFIRESNLHIAAMEDAARQGPASAAHTGADENGNESTITAEGQTTIPSDIRRSIGAVSGTCLEWQVLSDGRLFVRVKIKNSADVNGNTEVPKQKQFKTNSGQHDHGVFT